jgi:hypothetical protein
VHDRCAVSGLQVEECAEEDPAYQYKDIHDDLQQEIGIRAGVGRAQSRGVTFHDHPPAGVSGKIVLADTADRLLSDPRMRTAYLGEL